MKHTLHTLLILISCGLIHCNNDPEDGQVDVRVYGEEFIEEGIPAAEMADGWAVNFERFDVVVEDVRIAEVSTSAPSPIDLSKPSEGNGHMYATLTVPGGSHKASSFTITSAKVVGSASKDGVTKTFDWTIAAPTRYTGCEATTVVEESKTATFQVTVHADHLFYDSLVSEEPDVRFQALADADKDADNVISQAELMSATIGAYDPGSDNNITNLWSWLEAQSSTLGHVNGEGHCDFERIKAQ